MPLRHAGQYYDSETGIFYNYFRDYDPVTGRYVESDPIGLDGGLNTYGYVGGNALSTVDPNGLMQLLPALAGGAATGGTATGAGGLASGLVGGLTGASLAFIITDCGAKFNWINPHPYEDSLIAWRPNPFNNPQDNCNQAKQKLAELKALKFKRKNDIDRHHQQYEKGRRLTPSGVSHGERIIKIDKSIKELESYIKNYCDPECPAT
ncbi:RHS repeat-associated core domain-containing protein [Acinetobacter thutiue]|uniref:RHS repeat-associated core domain-containing protein n=1 Tax=Acinetobacter thutiue TaxID=2998078 RepID=UPI0033074F16